MVSASTVQKVFLRGRDADRAAIATLLAAAAEGRGGALVVAGPVGIGRTALLAASSSPLPASVASPVSFVSSASFAVPAVELSVTGCPAESGLPYAALHRLLAGRPQAAFDGAAGGIFARCHDGAVPDRLAAGLATLTALRGLGGKARGPVVCGSTLRRVAGPAVAGRPRPGRPARRRRPDRAAVRAARHPGVRRQRGVPGRPAVPAARAPGPARQPRPAHRRRAHLAGDVAGVLAGMAGGNPRALIELAGALHAEQRHGQAAPPDTLPRDSPLRREYRAALRALPDATRRVLAALRDRRPDTGARSPDARPSCGVAVLLAAGHRPADLAAAERADLVHVDDGRAGSSRRCSPPSCMPRPPSPSAKQRRAPPPRRPAGRGNPGSPARS